MLSKSKRKTTLMNKNILYKFVTRNCFFFSFLLQYILDDNNYKIMWLNYYHFKVWYYQSTNLILKIVIFNLSTDVHIHMIKYNCLLNKKEIRKKILYCILFTWHSNHSTYDHIRYVLRSGATYGNLTLFIMIMAIIFFLVQNLSTLKGPVLFR